MFERAGPSPRLPALMHGVALPYALSVHSFIDKIGSYLAFAAIIGVALLVIMFFIQARETSLLRERAEDAEADLEQLRRYAEQVARQASVAQQAAQSAQAGQGQAGARPAGRVAAPPAAAGAAVASRVAGPPPGAPAAPRWPVAPAGVGAPALASATRLIPLPAPGPSTPAAGANGQDPAAPAPSFVARPTAAPSMSAAPPPAAATAAAAAIPGATAAAAASPGPTAAAAASPGPTAAAAASPGPTTASPAPTAPPAGESPPSGRAPRRDYRRGADEPGSGVGRGSIAIGAVLVVVIIVAAVLIITHHSSPSRASRSARAAATSSRSHSATTGGRSATVSVNPAHVRVAVLNGTATNNLAADVSAKLNKVGFQQGETANYVDQTQSSTTVGFLPGDRAQAQAVAKALGVGVGDVHQISSAAQQLVCPSGASACSDQVVVTAGANLNSDAS